MSTTARLKGFVVISVLATLVAVLPLESYALAVTGLAAQAGTGEPQSGAQQETWGDLDCDGTVGTRDSQALLRRVLEQKALSQTLPCPLIGDLAQVFD